MHIAKSLLLLALMITSMFVLAMESVISNTETTPLLASQNCVQISLHMFTNDDVSKVKAILESGFNVNGKDTINRTLLHYASEKGCVNIVQFLVQHGANINQAESYEGLTPLHFATKNKHFHVVAALLQANVSINKPDLLKKAPLHYAAQNSDLHVAKLLLDNGAHVNAVSSDPATPLDYSKNKLMRDMLEGYGGKPLDILICCYCCVIQ